MSRRIVMYFSLVALLALSALAFGSSALAGGGDLDPSFGTAGVATKGWILPNNSGGVAQMIRQPDGKIVVAGTTYIGNKTFFSLLRLTAAGDPDPSFSGDGSTVTAFDQSAHASVVTLQADGKILVGGYVQSEDPLAAVLAVARYNSDGSLDSSFGGDGTVTTTLSSGIGLSAIAAQPDGKIIIGSFAPVNDVTQLVLLRFNADGSADSSFGTAGKLLIDPHNQNPRLNGLAVLADGKILVAGGGGDTDFKSNFLLLRLLPDGSLDKSFGTAGRVETDFGGLDAATVMRLQADGKILLGGFSEGQFALARYNADGTLDAGFGSAGKVLVDMTSDFLDTINALAIRPDGRIVALGNNESGVNGPLLLRLNADGSLDNTFGNGGKVITPIVDGAPRGMVLLDGADPAILVGEDRFRFQRFNGNGSVDSSFGGASGKLIGIIAPSEDVASGVAVQADGKILAAGGSNDTARLARFNADGSFDTSFGSGGEVLSARPFSYYNKVAVLADGKIVVAGAYYARYSRANDYDYLVARYNSDGSLDTSFGQNGEFTLNIDVSDEVYALALQADGKILIAGRTTPYSRTFPIYTPRLLRLNADGSLDSSFGNGGIVSFGTGTFTALAVQADGKIVAGGKIIATGDLNDFYEFSLLRLNGDGSSDSTFGTNGLAQAIFSSDSRSCGGVGGLAIAPDGKIVATGYTSLCSSPGYTDSSDVGSGVLARFNGNGTLDSSFGDGGKVAQIGGLPTGNGVLVQPNDRIVVGGQVDGQFALFRANADGSTDEGFGQGGLLTVPFDGGGFALALAAQPDGKVVAAGGGAPNISDDFALVRLTAPPAATPTTGAGCSFSDVCADDYFGPAVANLVGRGVISGYGDNTFRPTANATRGQVAKIVVLATGLGPTDGTAPLFSDVPASNPFAEYITIAAQHGVISGYADGTFKPFNNVTRGQLAKIVVGAAGWALLDPANPTFRDVSRSDNFYKYIETAVEHGIISGYADETFKPYNNATRGQIAKIVYLAAPTSPTTPTPAAALPAKADSK